MITEIDSMKILDQAFEATKSFKPLTKKAEMKILDKTKEAAKKGEFEPFKTTSIFDGTAQNPDLLGEEPKRVQNLMP